MKRIKFVIVFMLSLSILLPSMKIQAAYRDSQGKVYLKPGIYQTLDKLEKSQDDMVEEFVEGPSTWVKSGYYSYEFLDSQKRYITIRRIDSEAVQDRRLVIPKEIDGHQVLGLGLWTDWVISADEEHYRVIDRELDIAEIVLPEGLEFLGAGCFNFCTGLKNISLPNSLVIIQAEALYDSGIDQIELPPGVYVESFVLEAIELSEDIEYSPYKFPPTCEMSIYSDSLVSFPKDYITRGFAEFYIRYHEKDSYTFDIPGYIDRLYIDKKLSKFQLELAYPSWDINHSHPRNHYVRKLIMNGKNTELKLPECLNDLLPNSGGLRYLYTVKDAKSIKEARKYQIPYYWKSAGKAKEVKGEKKNGAYMASWKKIKTTVHKYKYVNKYVRKIKDWKWKWKETKSQTPTLYKVYGKKTKNDSYQLIKTTKKKSIQSEYKYIKAVADKDW